ncbi:hypothetical protein P1X14_11740 [Sphingomonas sp. AOB5]|uniref:hypothetical protein n=1 Tax=Sphingomonas sp. AOB5 TaxID=3034017 RepID=UPI0023F9516D|nr:hypothetical protein [Sphingomonas sp. AOB5]MDF7775921.1 hypothetical protein [Sphingomonas sp. AOB5]
MKTLPLLAIAAVVTLSACKPEPEVVDSRAPDPQASALANAAPVELPPAIAASVSFRCQPGNTLLYVDFFKGDKMAILKTEKDGAPIMLKAANAGDPYVGEEGSIVTGNHKSASIVVKGTAAKSCKA